MAKEEQPWRAGKLIIQKQGDKEVGRYYWSTDDDKKIEFPGYFGMKRENHDYARRI